MTFKAYLKVCRPPLAILGLVASVGLLNWSQQLWTIKGLFIVAIVSLGNLGWTLSNELHDIKIDKINKAWKPLPSGQVSERNVFFMSALSILASYILNMLMYFLLHEGFIGVVVIVAHLCSEVYNKHRKDVLGNVCMAGAYGLAAFVSLYPHHLIFCFPFALLTLAHNLNNQYQDVKAEKTAGVVTAAQQLGEQTRIFAVTLLSLSFGVFLGLYVKTAYAPILVFLAVTVTTLVSSMFMDIKKKEKKRYWVIENLTRRLGRFLLLIGFLAMLF